MFTKITSCIKTSVPGSPILFFLISLIMGLFLAIGPALGEDPLLIKQILNDPEEYHMDNVFFQGTAEQVKALDPYTISSGDACYGAYTFSLRDESGEIPILVLGLCGTPMLRPPPFADGEKLWVHAHIHAPGHSGYFKDMLGSPIPDWPPKTVQAIASQIQLAPAPEE